MIPDNIVRFPLQRKQGKQRVYFFFVTGIPQFNNGNSFLVKTTSRKNVEDYIKPHNTLGVGKIEQLYTDSFQFTPDGRIVQINQEVVPPALQ